MEGRLSLRTDTGLNCYEFALAYAHPDRFIFADEKWRYDVAHVDTKARWQRPEPPSGHSEAGIVRVTHPTARFITHALTRCAIYQFHDTSDTSQFKQYWQKTANNVLRSHGGNLAAVVYRLQHEHKERLDMICRQIKRVLPVFDCFQLQETNDKVLLQWKAAGTPQTFGAHLTSDGSLPLLRPRYSA